MSRFIDTLSEHVRSFVADNIKAAPDQNIRLVFLGPPNGVLGELLTALTPKGKLGIQLGNGRIDVPVLLPMRTRKNPSKGGSGRCNQGYFVKVRNSEAKYLLGLLPPDDTQIVSIDSTVTAFGVAPASLGSPVDWVKDQFVQDLVEEALRRRGLKREDCAWLDASLMRTAEIDSARGNADRRWELLRRLFDQAGPSGKAKELATVAAACGLVAPSSAGANDESLHSVVDRIGEFFEREGFLGGFETLRACAEQLEDDDRRAAVLSAVDSFKEHVLSVASTAADFASAPTQYYCPFSPRRFDEMVPDWWVVLDAPTWNALLDCGPSAPESCIRVRVTDDVPLEATSSFPKIAENSACFIVSPHGSHQRPKIVVTRRIGARTGEVIGTIEAGNGDATFEDTDPPAHGVPLTYVFASSDPNCKPVSVKLIVLCKFAPGLVVHCRDVAKVTVPRLVRPAKKRGQELVECDLQLRSQGTQHVDLIGCPGIEVVGTVKGYGITPDDDDESEHDVAPQRVADGRWYFDAETDDECRYEFDLRSWDGKTRRVRINIRADDVEPAGATSEFHRLVLEVTKGSSARVNVTPGKRINMLQAWMLEDANSYLPLVLSPGFAEAWSRPGWTEKPFLGRGSLIFDPRPEPREISPPPELLACRQAIVERVRGPARDGLCELFQAGREIRDGEFLDTVRSYVEHYVKWLQDDYDHAALFDIVLVARREEGSDALRPEPMAVLLSPLHPLRFAWQGLAQHLLADAVDRRVRCPGASVLDPGPVPDSMELPIRSASGQTAYIRCVSVPSSSDYWGVLWNVDALELLGGRQMNEIFGEELGLLVSGLSAGFSGPQVVRAMGDVSNVVPGRSRLRVRLVSDTEGASECEAGLKAWSEENLGEVDPWREAAGRSLDVHDERGAGRLPPDAFVANLSAQTGGATRWMLEEEANAPARSGVDLAIIAHLRRINPRPCKAVAVSAVGPGFLTRERVRYQSIAASGREVIETRSVGAEISDPRLVEGTVEDLATCIEDCAWRFEHRFDEDGSARGVSFAPNLPMLSRGIEGARYCAVSSTDIDPSAFLNPPSGAYLWDYDLPSFSGRAQENVGYYLLAKHSEEIGLQVMRAIKAMAQTGHVFPDELVEGVLVEISNRGLPSLKRLASGGSAATGEIGLLIACRMLQDAMTHGGPTASIAPLMTTDSKFLNLLLPVDPFADQLDALRGALKFESFQRPDLLVASIALDGERPACMRLTPIEVKARTAAMSLGQRKDALEQSRSFARYLARLFEQRTSEPLWRLASDKLLSTWFSFGFRVYGQVSNRDVREALPKLHASVVAAIIRGNMPVEVDLRGRLVVVDASATSQPQDIDGDGFEETIAIKPVDASGIIVDPAKSPILSAICQKLGSWELLATCSDEREPARPDVVAFFPATGLSAGPAGQETSGTTPPEPPIPVPQPLPPVETLPKPASPPRVDHEPRRTEPSTSETRKEEPVSTGGIQFVVGHTLGGFRPEEREFFPSNTRLTQLNMGIVGDLGTGKTQLTKALIYQMSQSAASNFGRRPFFLIFDYKHDYTSPEFVEATGAKVVQPRRIPVNVFDPSTVTGSGPAWLERAKFLNDVLEKIYSGIGPVQRERMKESVRRAYDTATLHGKPAPTVRDVFAEYKQLVDKPDSPYAILSDMVDMELFDEEAAASQSFGQFLEGVVVIDLAALGQDDNTKNMLVVLLLNLFYEHMLRLEKYPFIGTDPQLRKIHGFLLVDEADNIMRYRFPVLRNVLLQGREFGVGVVLASQYLSHFKPDAHTNYREPLLTWFVHRVPNLTISELQGIGLTQVDNGTVERVKELGKHECLYKSLDVPGEFIRGVPFYELRQRDAN